MVGDYEIVNTGSRQGSDGGWDGASKLNEVSVSGQPVLAFSGETEKKRPG